MRFALISDTHIGASPMMFMHQQGYPERAEELINILSHDLKENQVEFLLHAGDIIDYTSTENIKESNRIFDILDIPIYLTLGNHDLTTNDGKDLWLKYGKLFFKEGKSDYTVKKDNLRIHILTTHWEETPFFWSTKQDAHILDERIRKLEFALEKEPDAYHIILTHSPVLGISKEQTGFDFDYHFPGDEFCGLFVGLSNKYPQLKNILSGHNHINSSQKKNGVTYITASSFVETPFEYKLFDFNEGMLSMKTVSLIDKVGFNAIYNYDKSFVQGRLCDRTSNLS